MQSNLSINSYKPVFQANVSSDFINAANTYYMQ